MRDRVREFTIAGGKWGDFPVLRPLPEPDNAWGVLAPLREIPAFARLIPVIPGDVFSHALHGAVRPLLDHLGSPPSALLRLVPAPYRTCQKRAKCISHGKNCQPGARMPICFRPEGLTGLAAEAAGLVFTAWADGRYVVIVEGPEFSL